MQIIDREVECESYSHVTTLFPIGDVHIGAFNCAENHLRAFVNYIKKTPNSLWVGGGDYCNCITPKDVSRFDARGLADWILEGDAQTIKETLTDIARQERKRFEDVVLPIKEKCLGLIEGNHEAELMKRSHNAHHYMMCDEMGTPNLTDCAFIRLRFRLKKKGTKSSGATVIIFITHGCGGGRSEGAEPNHLAKLAKSFEADIVLRGHSHTFDIRPPEIKVYIPRKGTLPDECMHKEIRKGNWGCWLKSYAVGPPTYDSQKTYPARPLQAMEIKIKPFCHRKMKVCGREVTRQESLIKMQECPYEMDE